MRIKYGIITLYNNNINYQNNESILEFRSIKNYKINGEYKLWRIDGTKWIHTYYKNNERNGEYKRWWNDKQLEMHCHYIHGKLNGEYFRWYIDGKISLHCYFKNDDMIKEMR